MVVQPRVGQWASDMGLMPWTALQPSSAPLGPLLVAIRPSLAGPLVGNGGGDPSGTLTKQNHGHPPTAVAYPPTAVAYPPTAVGYPPTAAYPPTAVAYPPTAVGYPPTAVAYPPTAVSYSQSGAVHNRCPYKKNTGSRSRSPALASQHIDLFGRV